MTDNAFAYQNLAWIIDQSDYGLFLLIASFKMQNEVFEHFAHTDQIAVYNCAEQPDRKYDFFAIRRWVEAHPGKRAYFVRNFQLLFVEQTDAPDNLFRFNLSRDALLRQRINIVFCVVLLSISLQGALIPWVAKKLDIIDRHADVMKTFNDYSDSTPMRFGRVAVEADGPWANKYVKDLVLPGTMLLAMIIRGEERLLPRGDTLLLPGDDVIIMARGFEDKKTYLQEKTVKVDSRRVGQPLSRYPGNGLIMMIRRGDKIIIPEGDTILEAGDKLVILKLEQDSPTVFRRG